MIHGRLVEWCTALKPHIDRCVVWVKDVVWPELLTVAREIRQRLKGFVMRHLKPWLSLFGVMLLFLGFIAVLWNGSVTSSGGTPSSVSHIPISALGWGFAWGVLILVCLLGLVLFFMPKKQKVEPEPTVRPPNAQPVPRPRVPIAFIGWYLVRVAMTPLVVGVLWWLWSGHPAPQVFVAEVKELYLAWKEAIGMHWAVAVVLLAVLVGAADRRVWWGAVVLGALVVFLQGYSAGPVPWPTVPPDSPFDNLDPWGAWLLASLWALCTYVGGAAVSAWGSFSGLTQIMVLGVLAACSMYVVRLFHATGEFLGVNQASERRFTATYTRPFRYLVVSIGLTLFAYYLVMNKGSGDPFWMVPYGRTGLLLLVLPCVFVYMGRKLEKHMEKMLYEHYSTRVRFPYGKVCYGAATLVWLLGILSLFSLI